MDRMLFLDRPTGLFSHETGRSKKTMTSGYGVEQQGTLQLRQQIAESVRSFGLELDGRAADILGAAVDADPQTAHRHLT